MEQYLLIHIPSVRKRIKRDIQILIKENICIEEDVKINKHDDFEYFIEFKNLKDNKYYKFVVSNNYPFHPPKIFINGKSIMFFHKISNLNFRRSLIKYIGFECFCCESILCSNNWSPSVTFNHILDEINKYKDIRHQILVRIIVDVIKRKYLIYDINIIEWLYYIF